MIVIRLMSSQRSKTDDRHTSFKNVKFFLSPRFGSNAFNLCKRRTMVIRLMSSQRSKMDDCHPSFADYISSRSSSSSRIFFPSSQPKNPSSCAAPPPDGRPTPTQPLLRDPNPCPTLPHLHIGPLFKFC